MKLKTSCILAAMLVAPNLHAQQTTLDPANRQLAHDVFKQLIEINSTDSIGSTTLVAEAMRKRLLDAGFSPADVVIFGPNPRKGNMVARIHGRAGSTLKPVLIICHTDVVEAKRDDWTTDPFVFTEKDGFFYGRGTQDMKDSDAAMVTAFIRMKREAYVPDRDLILALTADEEGGKSNGVDWLLKNHPDLINAEFALNPDSGGLTTKNGKPILLGVEATEKLYADYHVTATNPGGHSSLPTPDNAIYRLADALARLERSPFPFELNEVTRAELTTRATLVSSDEANDIHAILKTPPDPAAIQRLSAKPIYNATVRTTCVATMVSAGHAPNALPGRAQANINCRILPGHSQEEVRQDLIRIFADPTLTVSYTSNAGIELGKGSDRAAAPPPPLNEAVFKPLRETANIMWPGLTILPEMETGASDSIYTMAAGIPSYGFSGMAIEDGDERAHGRDERLGIDSYYAGVQFAYLYLKAMTGAH
ncbi:M20/M25/M40 family metallo-hydrolase [Granulicella sp. L60]|uniref:M20/M25/M40 family metallo-hydrolase n=1 Tax=Granulicella sp. L60 TaxID=1641866 RepID=UPI00131DD48A|nr:M20/M25/M40 family metallo-hydrolase [Granulicella sp. L60]